MVPFWSDRAYAKRAMSKFSFETKVDSIQLENFIEHTLPQLVDKGFKIGPNWDVNLAGLEIEPSELFSFLSEFFHQPSIAFLTCSFVANDFAVIPFSTH